MSIFFITVPLGLFFGFLIYGMYQALDIETHWQDPPYEVWGSPTKVEKVD